MKQIIAQGAEAIIYRVDNTVIKERPEKAYRIKEIDNRLRGSRTRREAKVLKKIESLRFTPKLIKTNDKDTIEMEFIDGEKIATCLEKQEYKTIAQTIGKQIRKLHDEGIIHGDLTTSNMILTNKSNVFFIDFGLSFFSQKVEDKAVDLHVLEEALEAKHHTIAKDAFEAVKVGYADDVVIKQLEKVELRGRNKTKH